MTPWRCCRDEKVDFLWVPQQRQQLWVLFWCRQRCLCSMFAASSEWSGNAAKRTSSCCTLTVLISFIYFFLDCRALHVAFKLQSTLFHLWWCENNTISLSVFWPYADTTSLLWMVVPVVAICLVLFLLSLILCCCCCHKRAAKYVKQIGPLILRLNLSQVFVVMFLYLLCSSQTGPE